MGITYTQRQWLGCAWAWSKILCSCNVPSIALSQRYTLRPYPVQNRESSNYGRAWTCTSLLQLYSPRFTVWSGLDAWIKLRWDGRHSSRLSWLGPDTDIHGTQLRSKHNLFFLIPIFPPISWSFHLICFTMHHTSLIASKAVNSRQIPPRSLNGPLHENPNSRKTQLNFSIVLDIETSQIPSECLISFYDGG